MRLIRINLRIKVRAWNSEQFASKCNANVDYRGFKNPADTPTTHHHEPQMQSPSFKPKVKLNNITNKLFGDAALLACQTTAL